MNLWLEDLTQLPVPIGRGTSSSRRTAMAEVDRLGSLVQRLSRSHSLTNSAINRITRYHERREHATVDCDSRRSMTAGDLPRSPRRSLDDNILRRPWLPIEQQDSWVAARPARITVSAANMQGPPSESIQQYVQNGNNSWVATQSGENCTPWGSSESCACRPL